MRQSLDKRFELYWKSIQVPADDQINWSSEECRDLNLVGKDLLSAFKPIIRKAFFAGYWATDEE